MKVLCVKTNGLCNDGITNSILNYYRHMNCDDVDIHVLKTKEVNPDIERQFAEINCALKFTDYRRNIFSYLFKTSRLIKKEKYDIVHIHGSSALLILDLLAAKIGGCKIRIAHSRNTTCDHKILDKLLRPFFYKLCNVRFSCGEKAGIWLFGNKTFSIINNGVDFKRFTYSNKLRCVIRERYGWNKRKVIGHVGNFNYQKNHKFLIDVFAQLAKLDSSYLFVLVGGGRKEFIDAVKEHVHRVNLDDKVIFMGSINNVNEVLAGMDIMMLPSHFEGLPNVVMEWQAMGLPAIVSDKVTRECAVVDSIKFVSIDNGVKPWVDAVEKLENADRLLAVDEAHKRMKEEGFDIEENAAKLKKIYLSLVGECT